MLSPEMMFNNLMLIKTFDTRNFNRYYQNTKKTYRPVRAGSRFLLLSDVRKWQTKTSCQQISEVR